MPTRREAKTHIDSFWTRRRIDRDNIDIENNINIRDLSNSLEILSDTLYGDLTHFFWELLQNADDSEYLETPRVDFVLSNQSLTYRTNEVGFTRDNVESLCAVGRSSKAGQIDTIGEKGIGFKSIFKIADVVTIHSGVYSFKLDTRPPLGNVGMVLPIWLNNAQNFQGTSIDLQFKADFGVDKVDTLRGHLASFDFTFLLFTKKIKVINLKVSIGQPFEKLGQLKRGDQYNHEYIETTIDSRPDTKMEHILFRVKQHGMPLRQPGAQDRPNRDETTILVAFPHHDYAPLIKGQNTYAYLPVNSFGFDFILHADFVLTANRKGIDSDQLFNKILQKGLPKALCSVFESLAKSEESRMKFRWLEYLGCLWAIHDPFLKIVAQSTIKELRSKELIRTELHDGVFRTPESCLTASNEFRDAKGELLITEGEYAQQVRSNAYSFDSEKILHKLGVTPFDILHFMDLLVRYIWAHIANFSSKEEVWHSRVAKLLYSHFSEGRYRSKSPEFKKFMALQIIPLDDGSWTSGDSCASGTVFMNQSRRITLPAGLNCSFIKASAAADHDRRQLYRLLGIKSCNEAEICKRILDSHMKMSDPPTLETLISHAVYIFSAHYESQNGQRLRLQIVDSNNFLRYQRRIHLPFGELGKALRSLFADDFPGILWLHPKYEDGVTKGERQNWFQFLCSIDGVHLLPPLHSGGRLSDEMKHILRRNGSEEFLWLLKNHYFSINDNISGRMSNKEVQTLTLDISGIEVCTDRGLRKLCETILPSLSSHSHGLLAVLQLKDPENMGWAFLGKFGVQTVLSSEFFVKQLQALKASEDQGRVKATASAIYNAMTTWPELNSSKLKATFHIEKLIFANPTGVADWFLPQQCVWKASFPCTKMPVLSKLYRRCENIFQMLLEVRDASLDDLVSELEGMESSQGPERTRLLRENMLPALDSLLGKSSLSKPQRQRLIQLHIFPVIQSVSTCNDPAQGEQLLRAGDAFWVADLNFLRSKFEGFLPLLDITGKLFKSSMHNIFGKLSMDSKRLSQSVKREVYQPSHIDITEVADTTLSNRLRRQSQYIIGIVLHEKKPDQQADRVTSMLSNIRAFRVPDITIRRYVLHGSTKRYGREDKGDVLLLDTDAELHVKVQRDLEIMDIIVPLSERFAERFDLGDTNRELLVKVLTTEKVEQFMEGFERAGIKTDPTTVFEIVTEDRPDEDSDDTASAEDLSDSLGLAFQNLRIDKTNADTGFKDGLFALEQHNHPQTPSFQSRRARNEVEVSSPFPSRRRSRQGVLGGPTSDNITANKEAPTNENVMRLAASLSNAKLTDTTYEVFQNAVTPFNIPLRAEPGKSSMPAFGMATAFEFTFSSPRGAPRPNTTDTVMSRTLDSNASSTSHTIIESSSEPQSGSEMLQSSPNYVHGAFRTPTRPFRRSDRPWSGLSPRSGHLGNVPVSLTSAEDTPHEIGLAGEHLIYQYFENKLSPAFMPENWTSKARNKIYQIPFSDGFREKDFADFTYVDTDGLLGTYLTDHVPGYESPTGQRNITYHLEVKSTLGNLQTPALLSNNQISMAKRHSGRFSTPSTQTDVYILVRVYGLGSDPPQPQFCVFPDPWDLICQNSLLIEGEAGIFVRPKLV